MYNKMKQFCLRTAAVMMLVFALSFQSFAASAKIAFSDPSTQAGSEFDVRMKFTSTSGDTLGNTDVMLAYDATALEFLGGSDNASGGSGAIRVTSGMEGKTEIVTNLKFRALKAGTTQITVSSWEGYDADGQTLTMDKQGSSTIQIAAGEQTYSSDAALQSLQISPGTLEPAFSPEVENYTATVGLDTERLTVGAIANSDKAVVSVEGAEGLQPGENTVICRVTAEDGTTVRTYTVVVNKAEGGENMETNAGDTEQTVTPADVLVHLEAGRTPASIGITAIPSDAKIPAGMVERDLIIGEATVKGWIPSVEGKEQDPDYCIFYGIDADGEAGFYRYDTKNKTIQKYFEYENSGEMDPEYIELATRYNELTDDYSTMLYIAIGASAAAAVLLLILIVVLVKRSRSGHGGMEQEKETPDRSGSSRNNRSSEKQLSDEERYMMGEEEHEEEDFRASSSEAAASREEDRYLPDESELEMVDLEFDDPLDDAVGDVEKAISRNLAREAAEEESSSVKAYKQPMHPSEMEEQEKEDDFEVFDLDKD